MVIRYSILMSTEINKILSIYFKGEIRNGIKDLHAYTEKIERYLEDQKHAMEEKKDSEDLSFNISLRLGYGRHIEIFTKSAIISIYTYLEFFLENFCKKVHKYNKKSISPKDLSGNGIFRSKAYLEKILLINFSSLDSEWDEIVKLNKIRNFLIHSNGVATSEETKSKICEAIQGISGVELEEDHLKVSSGYIEHILSVIEKTLTKIEDQYSTSTA